MFCCPGNASPRRSPPINLNHYATKKSVAESMLDVALFVSNATQLKVVLEQGPSSLHYTTLVTLISISLLLQVVIGILLMVIDTGLRDAVSDAPLVNQSSGRGSSSRKIPSHKGVWDH
ncbi:Ninjurin-2, partial [Eschrichtius robustus]|nr:Ninjurin-2 [Eschrichtius robustus]